MDEIKEFLEVEFSKRFKKICRDDCPYYVADNGCFRIVVFYESEAFCLEYADSLEEAELGGFGEDGEWFYTFEMSKEEMLEAMLEEINGCEVI